MISGRFFENVFVTEIYKPVRKLGPLKTVIDLGATTGEFSLWVYPQAERIYAIEADKNAFGHLLENTKEFYKIIPIFLAIAGKNENRYISQGTIGASSIVQTGGKTGAKVPAKTLATFMNEYKIEKADCLKIDVESAEKEIFEAEDFPEVARKIKFIIGEPHSQKNEIRRALKKNGFRFKLYKYGYIARRK